MTLQLQTTRPASDSCRVDLTGKLMMGEESRQVEAVLEELLEAGVKKVVFDLSKLESIDSTGVGVLVVCHAKLQKVGGGLRLAAPAGIVLHTLQMTHVDRLVPVFATIQEAEQNLARAESA